MTTTIKTAIGAYRQADLERMEDQEVRDVRDWAGEQFNRHLAGHGDSDESCEAYEYLEILQGAADELLLGGHRAPVARRRKRKPTASGTTKGMAPGVQAFGSPLLAELQVRSCSGFPRHEVAPRGNSRVGKDLRALISSPAHAGNPRRLIMERTQTEYAPALRARKLTAVHRGLIAAWALLALASFATPVFAGEIYGRVEAPNGSPAVGARVEFQIQGTPYEDTTDEKGRYSLTPRETGRGKMRVTFAQEESTLITAWSFDDPSRFDLELYRENGHLRLRRR